MTTAYDTDHDIRFASFLDRLEREPSDRHQPNMLLPSTRFTLFALTAIAAGAALAFVT